VKDSDTDMIDAEVVDNETGEIIEQIQNKPETAIDVYRGIASGPFAPEAAAILLEQTPDDVVEIRPDGIVYFPGVEYRNRLNKAFGPGAWALMPQRIVYNDNDKENTFEGALFVHGRFVAAAIGSHRYNADNGNASYAGSAEAAKTDCLGRCCKDLGIAAELWDKRWVARWIADNAVQVWCENIGTKDKGKKKPFWRRVDAAPIDMYPWKEQNGNAPRDDRRVRDDDAYQTSTAERPTNGNGHATQQAREQVQQRQQPAPVDRPNANERNLASMKQVGRFRAIARSNGWTDPEMSELVRLFGFDADVEITRSVYDEICTALEAPHELAAIREKLNAMGTNATGVQEIDDDDLPF
jgi:hypothetical protein